jgi:coproporphyrinogen III oxidase
MLRDSFLETLQQKWFDALGPLVGPTGFARQTWNFSTGAGTAEVCAGRGGVFEKACVSTIAATVTIPDRDYQSSIQWLGIQTFPENPHVPMLMGVFERVDEQNLVHHPAYFDVYPAVACEEDRKVFSDALSDVCRRHGRSYPDLPEGYRTMFRQADAGTGVGYGIGLALMPDEKNHDFFTDAANAILKTYCAVVERRKDTPVTSEDRLRLQEQRARWVKFIFMDNRFFSGGIQLGVPPECFMLHMLPPTVTF